MPKNTTKSFRAFVIAMGALGAGVGWVFRVQIYIDHEPIMCLCFACRVLAIPTLWIWGDWET